jgi:hypothetical protein
MDRHMTNTTNRQAATASRYRLGALVASALLIGVSAVGACSSSSDSAGPGATDGAAPDAGVADALDDTNVVSGGNHDGGSDGALADGALAPVVIKGQLVAVDGSPLAARVIQINAAPTITTDGTGHFSATVASVPYTITAVANPSNTFVRFENVTTTHPVVVAPSYGANPMQATVPATATGEAGGLYTWFIAHPSCTGGGSCGDENDGNGTTASLRPSWYGTTTQSNVPIIALATDPNASNTPKAYGKASVTFSPGDTVPVPIPMQAIGSLTASGTVSAPAGFAVAEKDVGLLVGPRTIPFVSLTQFFYASDKSATSSFSFPVPDVADPIVSISASASSAGASTFASVVDKASVLAAKPIALTLPQVPTVVAPSAGDKVVVGTKFSWSPVSGCVYVSYFTGSSFAGAVITDTPSHTLPDLSAFGVTPSAGTDVGWFLSTRCHVTSVDAVLVAPTQAQGLFSYSSPPSTLLTFGP